MRWSDAKPRGVLRTYEPGHRSLFPRKGVRRNRVGREREHGPCPHTKRAFGKTRSTRIGGGCRHDARRFYARQEKPRFSGSDEVPSERLYDAAALLLSFPSSGTVQISGSR